MEPAQTLYQRCSTPGRSYARNMCVGFGAGPDTKSNQSRRHIPRRCLVTKAKGWANHATLGSQRRQRPRQSPQPHQYGVLSRHLELKLSVHINFGNHGWLLPIISKMYTRPGVPPFKLIGSISLGLLTVSDSSDFLPRVYPTIAFSLSRSFSGSYLAIADRFIYRESHIP